MPELSSEGFELAAEPVDVEKLVEEVAEPVDETVEEPAEELVDVEEGVAAAGLLDLLGVVDAELG